MTYDEALVFYKDIERPSLDAFINMAKTDFLFLSPMVGVGWVLHAVEIAEQLKKASEK